MAPEHNGEPPCVLRAFTPSGLLRYAGSDAFAPQTELGGEALAKMLKTKQP